MDGILRWDKRWTEVDEDAMQSRDREQTRRNPGDPPSSALSSDLVQAGNSMLLDWRRGLHGRRRGGVAMSRWFGGLRVVHWFGRSKNT